MFLELITTLVVVVEHETLLYQVQHRLADMVEEALQVTVLLVQQPLEVAQLLTQVAVLVVVVLVLQMVLALMVVQVL
jgi:hypothetical protein